MDDDSIAQDILASGVKNAAWKKMESVLLLVNNNSMSYSLI